MIDKNNFWKSNRIYNLSDIEMMHRKIRKIFLMNRALFFGLTAFAWGLILFIIDIATNQFSNTDFFSNLLFNAHGMMFDLVVLGILLTLYDSITQKRNEIDRLKEEIDDFRFWSSDEAKYRIAGCVRRLNKLNSKQIDLSDCNLEGMNLGGLNFDGADFRRAKLSGANFENSILKNSNFTYADLFQANFRNADFSGSKFIFTRMNKSDIRDAKFNNTEFQIPRIGGAFVASANWIEEMSNDAIKGFDRIRNDYKIDKLATGWMSGDEKYELIGINDSYSTADDRM